MPSGWVSRYTRIFDFRGDCLLLMKARRLSGPKLLLWDGQQVTALPDWPAGDVAAVAVWQDQAFGLLADGPLRV